jgi:hypothetical protein
MPTTILPARSTEEKNDVLTLRYELLRTFGAGVDGLTESSRRVVDALDLFPDTINLVAYENGRPIGTCRFVTHRPGDSLLRASYDFDDASTQVRAPVAQLDWLGVSLEAASGPRRLDRATRLATKMLEFGLLLLARRQVATLLGSLPAELGDSSNAAMHARLGIQFLRESPDADGARPFSLDVQSFYQEWVRAIRDREVLRFQDLFYVTVFEPGEILFVQGERGSSAHLIQDGEVDVILHQGDKLIPLVTLSGSQLVGEIAMITQEARTASMIARTAVNCITLDRQAFLGTLDREPHLSMDIFKIFSKRLAEANQRLARKNAAEPREGKA